MNKFFVGFIGMAIIAAFVALLIFSIIAALAYFGWIAAALTGVFWVCLLSGIENWANG
jgi:hypothetical protein